MLVKRIAACTHLSSTVTSYSEILVGNCNFSYPLHLTPPLGDPLGRSLWFLVGLPGGQATIWCKNIHEKLNPLSRVHARHRRQTDRQTDDRRICHAAKRNVVSSQYSHVWLKRRKDRSDAEPRHSFEFRTIDRHFMTDFYVKIGHKLASVIG